MPAANQPTINSVFRETRRSSRRNTKKLGTEVSESPVLVPDPTLVDGEAAVPCFVEEPNVSLPAKTRKPRSINKSGRGKKKQVLADSSQTRLNFGKTTLENIVENVEECSEPTKKVVTALDSTSNAVSHEDIDECEKPSLSSDVSEKEKCEELQDACLQGNECQADKEVDLEPGHVMKLKVSLKLEEKVKTSEKVEGVSEILEIESIGPEPCKLRSGGIKTFAAIENLGRQSQNAPTSRSHRMLLTVNQSDHELASKTIPVIRPDKASSKTKVELGKSVPMQRNLETKLLVSPVKRKQVLASDQDVSNSSNETPSSPSKMVRKDLFEKSDAAKNEEEKKTELHLPVKYQMLLDQFVALETTAQILFNRKEQIQFEKIVSAVQTTTRRNFTLIDLAKIFQVESNFYQVAYEKKFSCAITKSFSWVLCLYPILEDKKNVISAADLISRRKQFFAKLIDIVHGHHFKFLHNLNPSLKITQAKILRWHPKFQIEKLPDIEPLELPEKPTMSKPRQGLNELILKSKEKATEKLDRALAKIEASSLSPLSSPKGISPHRKVDFSTKEPRQLKFEANSNLAGISEKLRLKIMAKEAVKAQEKLEMNTDQRTMNEKLPNVAKVLRVTFLSDKRCAIPQDEIVSKCGSSVKGGISREQTDRALKLIMECVPQWLSIVAVQSKHYVKVNKSMDFNLIVTKIQEKFPV